MTDSFLPSLENLGYFKDLDPHQTRSLKQIFATRGWLGIFGESHRLYAADAEDMAEGGIGAFIAKLERFLANQGVDLPEIEDQLSESGYAVRIGAERKQIYGEAEMGIELTGDRPGLIWGLSMVRGFRIVDELLAAAESPERVYAVNGGNDLFAFLATPELFRLITTHPDSSPSDGPYKPTEEYPWFGQPIKPRDGKAFL